jgi:hypothetical protein
MFLIADTQKTSHIVWACVPSMKFHMSNYNDLLALIIQPKAKEYICTAGGYLFYILLKSLKKTCIFF